jgi:hypothetical protein
VTQVLEFIADRQQWILGLLGLVLLFYLGRALLARREQRRALFELEQELARTRYRSSALVLAIALLIMAAVFGSSTFLLPALDPPPTPTPTALPPTVTSTPPAPTTTSTVAPSQEPATPTPSPTSNPSPITVPTDTPVIALPACANPNARLTSPGVNQTVRGEVRVRGTANTPNFQYYKIEVGAGPNPKQWRMVGQLHHSPVTGGVLGTFGSGAYPTGTYTLRLVAVDRTGNYPDPCRVTVIVQR